MALIKCPECGKAVSDKSMTCVGCGFPIFEWLLKTKSEKEDEERKRNEKQLSDKIEKENAIKYASLNDKRNVSVIHKEMLIEIQDGKLTLRFPRNITITDNIWNFSLEYFSISMGINVGIMINNISKSYTSGVLDIVCKGNEKEKLILFKEIMENNGLYMARSRFNVLYKKSENDKELVQKRQEQYYKIIDSVSSSSLQKEFNGIYRYTTFGGKQEVYCPRCGSEKCSHYQEQKIIPGKVKTKYTANLNPFKPFTLINKKEKVLRKEEIVTESKFVCNNCGKIFK